MNSGSQPAHDRHNANPRRRSRLDHVAAVQMDDTAGDGACDGWPDTLDRRFPLPEKLVPAQAARPRIA
ncbi:hypothetical protein EGK76_05080 [Luteimonas sp. 100069]|nr:hypothetical protein EGK76_05080 [Luteimonas sp. 100069]